MFKEVEMIYRCEIFGNVIDVKEGGCSNLVYFGLLMKLVK